jgi:GTPase SAR1 family protein
LKVVIRGDRGTGKSSLFNRLQGKPFATEYTPTETLQSAKVSWNYRTSHDVVNLDVWDVVDANKVRKSGASGLKLVSGQNEPEPEYEAGGYDEVDLDMVPVAGKSKSQQGGSTMGHLDTSVVDVLRGTHAVVLMFNPMKKWTWEYVKRELDKIPNRIQVLIMANFKDVLEAPDVLTISSETVDAQEVRDYIEFLPKERPVFFLEASMLNCFGLKGLKTFLNLPFLLLQREVIETQLRQNTTELQNAQDEYRLTTENDSYDNFLKGLAVRATAKPPSAPSALSASSGSSSSLERSSSSVGSPTIKAKDEKNSNPVSTASNTSATASQPPKSTPSSAPKASMAYSAVSTTKPKEAPPAEEGGFFSKVFGGKKKEAELVANDGGRAVEELKKLQGAKKAAIGSVDDFAPETDDSWLKDDDDVPVAKLVAKASSMAQKQAQTKKMDDSDDDDAPNPALANYDEELDASDQLMMAALAKIKAEKAEKEKPKTAPAKPITAPSKVTPPSKVVDDDEDDDEDNPMLAAYEDDLDFDDQQIQGKPRPQPVAKPTSSTKKPDSDEESDSEGNPSLAGYSEDIDLDDLMLGSGTSSPAPRPAQDHPKPNATQHSRSGTPTPVVQPKLASPVTTHSPTVPAPHNAYKSSKKLVIDDDSDSDNDLVAKDDGSDSDEDFAGFVPKRTAAVPSKPVVDSSDIPDFNPLDADDEADADAFWAQARQPPPRKPSTTTLAQNSANQPASQMGTAAQGAQDPFAFVSSPSFPSPVMHHSSSSKDIKDKDKHHKHKDKHHKHKDKRDKRSQNGTAVQSSQPPQPAAYAAPNTHSEWDFMAAPPVASVPPPTAAPKKSVFYL